VRDGQAVGGGNQFRLATNPGDESPGPSELSLGRSPRDNGRIEP
jgi:hypothetical protein